MSDILSDLPPVSNLTTAEQAQYASRARTPLQAWLRHIPPGWQATLKGAPRTTCERDGVPAVRPAQRPRAGACACSGGILSSSLGTLPCPNLLHPPGTCLFRTLRGGACHALLTTIKQQPLQDMAPAASQLFCSCRLPGAEGDAADSGSAVPVLMHHLQEGHQLAAPRLLRAHVARRDPAHRGLAARSRTTCASSTRNSSALSPSARTSAARLVALPHISLVMELAFSTPVQHEHGERQSCRASRTASRWRAPSWRRAAPGCAIAA